MNNDISSSENKSINLLEEKDRQSSPTRSGDNTDVNEVPENIDPSHWEFILGELVHLVGLFILKASQANEERKTEVLFDQLLRHLEILNRMPDHDGSVLICRTHSKDPTPPTDNDYVITFGDLMVRIDPDQPTAANFSKKKPDHLQGALKQAFDCFADQGIQSLRIQPPDGSAKKNDQLRLAINIIARFETAVCDGSSIRFRCYGRALTFSVIHDANGQPDVNLTMTAALNGLSPVNARELIKQAKAFHELNKAESDSEDNQALITSYNQIFSTRSLKSQIIKPPVEVNNIPRLQMDGKGPETPTCRLKKSQENAAHQEEPEDTTDGPEMEMPINVQLVERREDSEEQIQELLTEFINIAEDQHKAAMEALMADDYADLTSDVIGERFVSVTRLFYTLGESCQDPVVLDRVIDFYRHRLKRIRDSVLSNIIAQRQGLKIISDAKSIIVGLVHPRLLDLITLLSENVAAQRRNAIIKKMNFDFDGRYVTDLAVAFGLSETEGHHILDILKHCFSVRGSFIRPTFEGRIPLMTEFGNAIFEILWCLLKETPRRRDRLDFLNAIQLLMDKLVNPKRAIQYLLADICQKPDRVGFTDRNAFSLANILLHRENKELYVDINRTPESVLTFGRRVNKNVRDYMLWRHDADSVRMLTKLRTIHRVLEQTLLTPPGEPRPFEITFLMALEREAIIFTAIVGSSLSRIFLRELILQYGSPNADIYRSDTIKMNLPEIMYQLQIVVRALGRGGTAEDVECLRALEEQSRTLYRLDHHPAHKLKVKQLMNIIPPTINAMK